MSNPGRVELFLLKCAAIETELATSRQTGTGPTWVQDEHFLGDKLEIYIRQFTKENRMNATKMAQYYQIFYMLENDIRKLISETMEASYGINWWETNAPQAVQEEARRNRQREEHAGVTPRSDNEIDYITFGQLYEIIKDNWDDFAGMLSSQPAVSRVLSGLNMLRGTIAHCGLLADDEVDRLKLAIRDWFRVLEGPKS